MKLKNFIPLFLFSLILAIIVQFFTNDGTEKLSSSQLELVDSGNILDLNNFTGDFYIIHLFASWCNFCKNDDIYLRYIKEKTNIPIIGIAVRDNINQLKEYGIKNFTYDYLTIDKNSQIASLIQNRAIPETIIINPQGKVILRHTGALSPLIINEDIMPLIQQALK